MIMGVSPAIALTVAGLFADITRSEWVQLWSGVMGAIVSAGVAALVAVVVLTRSNKVQRKLAAEALTHQKALGEEQLAEQRAEAARVREQAAIADVIIATEGYMHAARETSEEVVSRLGVFQAAVARWRVELGGGPMEQELLEWTQLIFTVALRQSNVDDEHGENSALLAEVIGIFSGIAISWVSADSDSRDVLREKSKRDRLRIGASFSELGGI